MYVWARSPDRHTPSPPNGMIPPTSLPQTLLCAASESHNLATGPCLAVCAPPIEYLTHGLPLIVCLHATYLRRIDYILKAYLCIPAYLYNPKHCMLECSMYLYVCVYIYIYTYTCTYTYTYTHTHTYIYIYIFNMLPGYNTQLVLYCTYLQCSIYIGPSTTCILHTPYIYYLHTFHSAPVYDSLDPYTPDSRLNWTSTTYCTNTAHVLLLFKPRPQRGKPFGLGRGGVAIPAHLLIYKYLYIYIIIVIYIYMFMYIHI